MTPDEFWRHLTRNLRPYVDGGEGRYDTVLVSAWLVGANSPVPDWVRARIDPMDPLGERYEVAWIQEIREIDPTRVWPEWRNGKLVRVDVDEGV